MSKRRSSKRRGGGLGGLAIMALLFVCLLMMMQRNRGFLAQIRANEEKAAALQESVEAEKERTLQLERLRAYMSTDEYLEQAARERLGMVKDQEILFEEAQQEP